MEKTLDMLVKIANTLDKAKMYDEADSITSICARLASFDDKSHLMHQANWIKNKVQDKIEGMGRELNLQISWDANELLKNGTSVKEAAQMARKNIIDNLVAKANEEYIAEYNPRDYVMFENLDTLLSVAGN